MVRTVGSQRTTWYIWDGIDTWDCVWERIGWYVPWDPRVLHGIWNGMDMWDCVSREV